MLTLLMMRKVRMILSTKSQYSGNGTLQAAHVDVDLHHYHALLVFIGTQTTASVLSCR